MTDPQREALTPKVQEVLWNASNYPEAVQSRILGQDIGPLTGKVVDAILDWLAAHDAQVRADTAEKLEELYDAYEAWSGPVEVEFGPAGGPYVKVDVPVHDRLLEFLRALPDQDEWFEDALNRARADTAERIEEAIKAQATAYCVGYDGDTWGRADQYMNAARIAARVGRGEEE